MFNSVTEKAIDVLCEIEERLESNGAFICNHGNDERIQGIISELESNSYSMYSAARFILDNMREFATDVLEKTKALDRCIQMDMICSGLDIYPSDETEGQGSEAK